MSESTLAADRRKGGLYARAGVPEFWIVNLVDRRLETHRAPERARRTRIGWRYADVRHLGRSESVSPLVAPDARLAVADLVP